MSTVQNYMYLVFKFNNKFATFFIHCLFCQEDHALCGFLVLESTRLRINSA